MEFVDGHILRNASQAEADLTAEVRSSVGSKLASTLASLHRVDLDAVGLGDLARRDGYIERQVKRWTQQYSAMAVPGVDHGGIIERIAEQLLASVPEPQGVAVVHGDYRLDNTVVDDHGNVVAILDWEICTLGDPLADLGTLLCYWAEPGDGDVALLDSPTLADGFEGRAAVTAAYAEASGFDVARAPYYCAFGYWRLACILQGVYARYVGGAAAGDQGSVDGYPTHIRRLAELAQATLATDPGA
jgi:aminoglycoside phosphotransferase (APT) family kinase protein